MCAAIGAQYTNSHSPGQNCSETVLSDGSQLLRQNTHIDSDQGRTLRPVSTASQWLAPSWLKWMLFQVHMQTLHPGTVDSSANCFRVYRIALISHVDTPTASISATREGQQKYFSLGKRFGKYYFYKQAKILFIYCTGLFHKNKK